MMPNHNDRVVGATLHTFDSFLEYPDLIDVPMYRDGFVEPFWLNPRRIRGSDFLMRWAQGYWSELRAVEAINSTGKYFAVPYGASSVAPDSPQEQEAYFDALDSTNPVKLKRPDLLIYKTDDKERVKSLIRRLESSVKITFKTSSSTLPFVPESEMSDLFDKAIMAIECENSLWKADLMPNYADRLRPQKRLGGKLGLPKSTTTPTVIVKNEDFNRIKSWVDSTSIPIHVWQIFYDIGIGISLEKIVKVINDGLIQSTVQKYSEPGGGVTSKPIYKIYHHYCYNVGRMVTEPRLSASTITANNGHVMPYVKFTGRTLKIYDNVIRMMDSLGGGGDGSA